MAVVVVREQRNLSPAYLFHDVTAVVSTDRYLFIEDGCGRFRGIYLLAERVRSWYAVPSLDGVTEWVGDMRDGEFFPESRRP